MVFLKMKWECIFVQLKCNKMVIGAMSPRGGADLARGAIVVIASLKLTKVTLFTRLFYNSKNSIHDIRPFCHPLFCQCSIVNYTSSPFSSEAIMRLESQILLKCSSPTLLAGSPSDAGNSWNAKTVKTRSISFLIHSCSIKYGLCGLINGYYYMTLPIHSHAEVTIAIMYLWQAVSCDILGQGFPTSLWPCTPSA